MKEKFEVKFLKDGRIEIDGKIETKKEMDELIKIIENAQM